MSLDAKEMQPLGKSIKRKEDPRFIRGQGRYVDDIVLPHMLHMVLVRSPYSHARIKAIHIEDAMAIKGVKAILTGEDLGQMNLAWMPTLAGDRQMVLATGKVLFQYQEVAAVVAETREAAEDGASVVNVEYEPLTPVMDPFFALSDEALVLREDREQKNNHIFHWEVGDEEDRPGIGNISGGVERTNSDASGSSHSP